MSATAASAMVTSFFDFVCIAISFLLFVDDHRPSMCIGRTSRRREM